CESMGHQLNVTLPAHPVYLHADPIRLAQVVDNLLTNACKFTDPDGRIDLLVEPEGEQVVLRVRDNGIGMTVQQLPAVFEMFKQLDTSLERSRSGLGIGLTLVKSLVEMHGGTVAARSAGTGQGSEFVISLPAWVAMSEAPPQPEPDAGAPTSAVALTILVVDDNRDSATSLALLLKMTGHETYTAYDGVEAVESAATFQPDVILLDIGLPKLNGLEVARKIRAAPWGKRMSLVALTGWGQAEDRRRSAEVGFNAHLVKPVDFSALTKLLAELRPTPV
ncbi:MAG: response regulator, partial [Gammaproteobacteria bacterium]|nr:response regulator [Gammaproteobacteria bacterium]